MDNKELKEMADEAKKFIEKHSKTYIAERLRDGYIGNLVYTDNGTSYIQSVRGSPYGTVVAIKTETGISICVSYLDKEDMKHNKPCIGLYIALTRALDNASFGKNGINKKDVKSRARKQIEHFEKRALAYFYPDVYSYSRGQEGKKVVYENYDEIHKRRAMILGEKIPKQK